MQISCSSFWNRLQPAVLTDDLCRRTGVAERTLRNTFHECFGVGPVRFLKMRQLRNIRHALLAADPTRETVTRIAMRFGISDLSLFAYNPRECGRAASSVALQGDFVSTRHAHKLTSEATNCQLCSD